MSESPTTLLAGRYRLGELLGSGASAVVYAAHDELLGVDVAIKLLQPRDDASELDRVIQEAIIAMSLAHPAIVRCDGAFNAEGRRFIVMERVHGKNLAERLEDGPISMSLCIAATKALASALEHAHAKGVLHRDVAPANILLLDDSDPSASAAPVKLIDFGIAKQLTNETPSTQTKGIGTAAYAAPEQLFGKPTAQSDLYGLGAVAFHMITGKAPELGRRRGIKQVLPVQTPAWFADLLNNCLALDPNRRIASASLVLAAIEQGQRRRAGVGMSLRARRALRAGAALFVASTVTISILIARSGNVRDWAAQLCAKLEATGVVHWENQKILSAMALTAADSDDVETIHRLFEPGRLASEHREWLLYESFTSALHHRNLNAADALITQGVRLKGANIDFSMQTLTDVFNSGSLGMINLLLDRGLEIDPCFVYVDLFTQLTVGNDLTMFRALLNYLSHRVPMPPLRTPPLQSAFTSLSADPFIAAVIEAGPRLINAVDERGATALINFTSLRRLDAIERVLEIPGVDIEAQDLNGFSALRHAIDPLHEFSPTIVRLLLAKGARTDSSDKNGQTVLATAEKMGCQHLLIPVDEKQQTPEHPAQ